MPALGLFDLGSDPGETHDLSDAEPVWREYLLARLDAAESEAIARGADSARRVYLVPAFTGLGAPWWDAHARGAVLGLTRDCNAADIVRAGLEAVGYQTHDLLSAMEADGAARPSALRVDGGMANNDFAMQFLGALAQLEAGDEAGAYATAAPLEAAPGPPGAP